MRTFAQLFGLPDFVGAALGRHQTEREVLSRCKQLWQPVAFHPVHHMSAFARTVEKEHQGAGTFRSYSLGG